MAALEQHYTVNEVAVMWGVSSDTVRRRFRNTAGVLKLGEEGRRGKRDYVLLRIPESIVQKFHQQERNK